MPVRNGIVRVSDITKKNAEEFTLAKEKKRPFFQAAVVQYLGSKRWRIGLVPLSGEKAQWLEGLPYSEVLRILEQLEGRIRRADPDAKETRNYV